MAPAKWRTRISVTWAARRGRSTSTPARRLKFNIPEVEAVDRLVDLIKEHGKWAEPQEKTSGELAAH
jgi:hypothetical protein